MKRNIFKLMILMIVTLVLFTGCKVQTVEEFNREESEEIRQESGEEIREDLVDSQEEIGEELVDSQEEPDKDGVRIEGDSETENKSKPEDKQNNKTEDNAGKDKNKNTPKEEKVNVSKEDKKKTETVKVDKKKQETVKVNDNKDKNTEKTENTGDKADKTPDTKPVEKPKPTEEKKSAEKPKPTEKPKPVETPKPVEKPRPEKQYVTIEIRVDTILKNYDKLDPKLQSEKFVPANGVILGKTSIELLEGESVFDILVKATRQNRIHMDYQGGGSNQYGSAYIRGINNIYEFSCGELSGWVYKVNGTQPSHGVSAHKLKGGETISFNYTCDQGRDI